MLQEHVNVEPEICLLIQICFCRAEVGEIVRALFDLLSDEEKTVGSKSVAKPELHRQESMAEKVFREMDKDLDTDSEEDI